MKLLFCYLCHTIVQMKSEEKSCECGNIKGRYTDDINAEIAVKDEKAAAVLGINNNYLIYPELSTPDPYQFGWVLWHRGKKTHPRIKQIEIAKNV